jgi:hypothetical protein
MMAAQKVSKKMIRVLQVAVKQLGLRSKEADGRYKLLLMQYSDQHGRPVESSTQLDRYQWEDLMAILEAKGFRHRDGDEHHYRREVERRVDAAGGGKASAAQLEAIRQLARDLGWNDDGLDGFCVRVGKRRLENLGVSGASKIIEALKAMLSRRDGTHYNKVGEVAEVYGG